MKNILILLFYLCIVFSSFGFAESTKQQVAKSEFNFVSSKAVANNEFPNIFRPIGNWFKKLFGRKKGFYPHTLAHVNNVTLNKTEITENCAVSNKSCSNTTQTIEVSTDAFDVEGDVLIYVYKVSGGKIFGEGAKVFGIYPT